MTWQKKAAEVAAGKFVNFKDGEYHEIWFVGEPQQETIDDRFHKGQVKEVMNFPIEENGKEKILTPGTKLLRTLIEYDSDEPIIGRSLRIKKVGEGTSTDWIVKDGRRGPQQTIPSKRYEEEEAEEEIERHVRQKEPFKPTEEAAETPRKRKQRKVQDEDESVPEETTEAPEETPKPRRRQSKKVDDAEDKIAQEMMEKALQEEEPEDEPREDEAEEQEAIDNAEQANRRIRTKGKRRDDDGTTWPTE